MFQAASKDLDPIECHNRWRSSQSVLALFLTALYRALNIQFD